MNVAMHASRLWGTVQQGPVVTFHPYCTMGTGKASR